MYKKCILFLLVGLVAGGSSTNAGRWSKRETDPSEFSSSAYKGASSSPSNEQNQGSSTPLNVSEIESDNGLLEKIYKKQEELRKDRNRRLLVHLVTNGLSTNAGRRSRRETGPSVVPSPAYEDVSSSPFNGQNQDSPTPLNASEIESDNGLLEKMYKWRDERTKDRNRLVSVYLALKRSSTNAGSRSRRETDPSVVPSPDYEGVSSTPFNGQNQNSSTPLNASGIESDNGLLEKMHKRKECLERFKVCLAAGASSANGGESSSTPNKQSLGCSSPSNGQSQGNTESATPISHVNDNVSDDGSLDEIMKVKELLRKAMDKYDEVRNTRTRELELLMKDILFYKNQVDKYIIQQSKCPEVLEKQFL